MSFWSSILDVIRGIAAARNEQPAPTPAPTQPIDPPNVAPAPPKEPLPQPTPTSVVLPDRPGDFIIPDIYPDDLGPTPHFEALPNLKVMGKEIVGCYIKASEGTGWSGEQWFLQNWPRLRALTNDSFFAGIYHFLRFSVDGARQADYLADLVQRAGGLGDWALACWVDVEEGGQGHWADDPVTHVHRKLEDIRDPAERKRLADSIRKCTSDFITRLRQRMPGTRIGLYGRGIFRDLQITDAHYGQDFVCDPAYTAKMPTMEAYGIPLDEITEWQLVGDGQVFKPGYPSNIPGWGATDYSVVIDGTRPTTLSTVRRRCLARAR